MFVRVTQKAGYGKSRVPLLLPTNDIKLVSTDGEKGCVIQFKDFEERYVEESIDAMELLLRGTNDLPLNSHS